MGNAADFFVSCEQLDEGGSQVTGPEDFGVTIQACSNILRNLCEFIAGVQNLGLLEGVANAVVRVHSRPVVVNMVPIRIEQITGFFCCSRCSSYQAILRRKTHRSLQAADAGP